MPAGWPSSGAPRSARHPTTGASGPREIRRARGNALDVLIEGAAHLPAPEHAIRDARRGVLIAGWCVTPGFALVRDEPPVLLRELLRPPASASRSAARKMPGPQ
jgi:hypothetical protein